MKIPEFHIIKTGETLYSVAEKYGLDVKDLADFNLIADPNITHPGQGISLQDYINFNYEVKEGDTLKSIAKRYRTTPLKLETVNELKKDEKIKTGQLLKIR